MKILIVSDSHGRTYNFSKVMDRVGPIDMLFHLGDIEGTEEDIEILADCPAYMVCGNNDFFSCLDREKVVEIGGYRIFMTHGHRYGVGYSLDRIIDAGKEYGCNIVMFGHTHIPVIESRDGINVINPGSITLPRQEGHKPSYVIMDIDRFGKVHFTLNFLEDSGRR